VCADCKAKGIVQLEDEIGRSVRLREIQEQLRVAGKAGDIGDAARIVQLALASGVRPVDILVGLITPLLYVVGLEWECGLISIAEEQRFTGFCERVFELVKLEVDRVGPVAPRERHALVFVINADGNDHTLGSRIVALWLQSKGIEVRAFHATPTPESLLLLIAEVRPCAILISLSLHEQKAYVDAVALRLDALEGYRPSFFAGGHAIKHRLVPPVPGVRFLETVTGLSDLIWAIKL
jgi:methanogenic corrinoid protein MtbC1